ncbi:MAG: hypothetical protein KZQ93_04730 [Candidatus Thiodiazotropha sp. (ex Monitilora ramsayi)]|nr:hypothetical protein [Candidatus Thiodiazotropha sp. (ex Monitilora ramsayi)]
MQEKYLIHGANALTGSIRYLKGEKFRYDPKSVGIYLSAACKTLSYLVDDDEALSIIAAGMSGEASEIYGQFEDFMEEFVKPDHALMISAGMDERMANYLFKDINNIQGYMAQRRRVNPEILRERIKELQYTVCSESTAFEEPDHALWRAINVIGGGAIITTNNLADTIIGGLASAFSQTYGGIRVGKGLDG